MAVDTKRIQAVAAARRGTRDRVNNAADTDDWNTAAYDKWVAMLEDALDADCDHLVLNEDEMYRTDFLMHLDAAIAFLEVYEGGQANVTPMKPRAVE